MAFPVRLPIPDAVVKIATKLEAAGYETWCGGAVRDNLLGLENYDLDLTTAAPQAEMRRLFQRTVPVGIEHGAIAVLDRANQAHEVPSFRRTSAPKVGMPWLNSASRLETASAFFLGAYAAKRISGFPHLVPALE